MEDWISPDVRVPEDNRIVLATDGLSVLPVRFNGRLGKYTWSFSRHITDGDVLTRLEGQAYFRAGTVIGWKPIS